MFIKRELQLESSRECILEKLEKQRNAFPYMGTVEKNDFCLYKSAFPRYRRESIIFVFTGKVTTCGSQTQVQYHVRPNGPAMMFAILMILPLIMGLLGFFPEIGEKLILICITINVIFYLIILEQIKTCITRFEQKLKEGQADGSVVPTDEPQ